MSDDEIPAQLFMAADDLLLVDTYKVDIGGGGKIGEEFGKDGLLFFITMEGRVNKTQDRRTVHMLMDAEFGFEFSNEFVDRMEMIVNMAKERGGA